MHGGKFIIMRAGSVKKENEEYTNLNIEMGKKTGKVILLPFWCKQHWLLLEIQNNKATIFDSAPSEMVFNEVKKWCRNKGIELNEKRGTCPQQRRYSRECGIFTIGFILARVMRKEMIGGIVSLNEVRNKLANNEPPTTAVFHALFEDNMAGGGENDKWEMIHRKFESWAAGKNLCFLLCAMLLVNKARETENKKGLRISHRTLLTMAKKCNIDMTNDRAQQNDVETPLLRMKGDLQLMSTKILSLTEIENVKVGETAIILKNYDEMQLPSTFTIITGVMHIPTKWEIHKNDNGEFHRSARGGHYVYGFKKGSVVLARREEGTDPDWSMEKEYARVQKETKRIIKDARVDYEIVEKQGKKQSHVNAKMGNPLENMNKNDKPRKEMRHAKIKAVMQLTTLVTGHWIMKGVPAEMRGTVLENDEGDNKKVLWTHKRCECEGWREIDDPIEDICPIPSATYLNFEPTTNDQTCECAADDDDEDNTAVCENDNIDEKWREQESLEPLGNKTVRAPLNRLTGGLGRNWKIITRGRPRKVHVLVWQALAEATRKKHVEWLLHISEMPADLHHEHFDRAVVELILRMAKERKWAWSTVSCIFSTVHTAVKNLNVYTNETVTYDLKESGYFLTAMRRAQRLARNAGPNTQLSTPMGQDTLVKLLKKSQDLKVRTLLAASWAFAARVGDMRQVEARDVLLPPNNKQTTPTAITFRKGKGGAFWGAYTIHTVLPLDTWKDMAEVINQRKSNTSLWTTADQRRLSALVNSNGLNLRSIRRGALLHNANRGVSDNDLQYLSGHKRIDTLMRYLGWGVESSSSKEAALKRHTLTGAGKDEIPVEPKKMGPHSGYQGKRGKRIEKPPPRYYARPPTSKQLGMKKDARKMEIHVKKVGIANIDEIKTMAKASKTFGKDCLFALQHLQGEKFRKYEKRLHMPDKKDIPKAGFSKKQLTKMIEYGKLVPLTEEGKSYVKGFPIVDGHKNRARALAEPFVNKFTETEVDYPPMKYPSRLENYAGMKDAKYVAQFDYSAYFDQFNLDDEARKFMVMRTTPVNGNDMWMLTRLPMGATFSPAIAQYTTWVICEPITKMKGVHVTTMIDNVRIVAQTETEFITAVRQFLERSEKAGLTLNKEADPYRTKDDKELAELGMGNTKKDFDFLGVCYNDNTIKNTARLIEKLTFANGLLAMQKMSKRQLAHILGLAIYMAHTIREHMVYHFELMRTYNKLFDEGESEWDSEMEITEALRNHAKKLITVVLRNEPKSIQEPIRPSTNMNDYDSVIVFDACKDAWAAKVHDVATGKTIRVMKRFAKTAKFSAHAEPMAATEILDWVKKHRPMYKKIALVTDHKALALGQMRWWTGFGGHSTAYHINEAFKRINNFAQVFYVEGHKNICDADSRSREAREAKTHKIIECNESWEKLEQYEHPYASERINFKYF